MKKKLLIGLGSFFAIVIAAIVAVIIYFWPYVSTLDLSIVTLSNIKALYVGLTEDPEVTNSKMKEIDARRSEKIKSYVDIEIREYTSEEQEKLESGELSETQLVAQIIAESVKSEDEKETENSDVNEQANDPVKSGEDKIGANQNAVSEQANTSQNTQAVNKESAEKIVARHIAQLYAIQGDFEGRVAGLVNNAKAYAMAYKKANPGITWRDAKVATMKHFMNTATSIENDCYTKVDNQIALLKSDLTAIGADLSIVETVKQSAYDEMEAKKAKIVQEGTAKVNK